MATAADVRELLSIPSKSASNAARPIIKAPRHSRPDGITRELFNLMGDNVPTLSLARPKMKEKVKTEKPKEVKKAARWEEKVFTNPARKDGLKLVHWEKVIDGQEGSTFDFAKFAVPPNVFQYSDDEYNNFLQDPDWTREETDYLLSLCIQYHLRFFVIADRYDFQPPTPTISIEPPVEGDAAPTNIPLNKPRTTEDLKDRYYAICRRLIRSRPPANGDENSKTALNHSYLFEKERETQRKQHLLSLFSRTNEQIEEEDFLYLESRRLEQTYARTAREREDLYRMLSGLGPPDARMGVGSGLPPSARNQKKRRSDFFGEDSPEVALSGSARRLTPAQEAAHLVQHFETNTTAGPSVHLRSTRITQPKAVVAPKVFAILSELGISPKLIMPTVGNLERLDGLLEDCVKLLDARKAMERAEYEMQVMLDRKNGESSGMKRSLSAASEGANKRARLGS